MKTVILALLLLVFVSQGEALRCRCDGKVKVCPWHVEECKAGEICGQILMDDGFTTDYFMGCMTEEKCKGYQFKETSQATCCDWDRCT